MMLWGEYELGRNVVSCLCKEEKGKEERLGRKEKKKEKNKKSSVSWKKGLEVLCFMYDDLDQSGIVYSQLA
jgi:hypothetical protein